MIAVSKVALGWKLDADLEQQQLNQFPSRDLDPLRCARPDPSMSQISGPLPWQTLFEITSGG